MLNFSNVIRWDVLVAVRADYGGDSFYNWSEILAAAENELLRTAPASAEETADELWRDALFGDTLALRVLLADQVLKEKRQKP